MSSTNLDIEKPIDNGIHVEDPESRDVPDPAALSR